MVTNMFSEKQRSEFYRISVRLNFIGIQSEKMSRSGDDSDVSYYGWPGEKVPDGDLVEMASDLRKIAKSLDKLGKSIRGKHKGR